MDWEENEQQPKMQPKEVCVFVVFFFFSSGKALSWKQVEIKRKLSSSIIYASSVPALPFTLIYGHLGTWYFFFFFLFHTILATRQ